MPRPTTHSLLLLLFLVTPLLAQPPGPAAFDYYLLSLSWSPHHCTTHPSDHSPQCDGPRPYGFIVHGLWPNRNAGRHPQNCAGPRLDRARVSGDVREIMPSDELIKHEWETHGTCSGLSPDAYFTKVLTAWANVTIPAEFRTPPRQVEFTPAALREKFASANPSFVRGAFTVKSDGRFFQEIRVCLTKDLQSRSCPDPGDTRNRSLIVRPVR
jgi:ribonuclease T2